MEFRSSPKIGWAIACGIFLAFCASQGAAQGRAGGIRSSLKSLPGYRDLIRYNKQSLLVGAKDEVNVAQAFLGQQMTRYTGGLNPAQISALPAELQPFARTAMDFIMDTEGRARAGLKQYLRADRDFVRAYGAGAYDPAGNFRSTTQYHEIFQHSLITTMQRQGFSPASHVGITSDQAYAYALARGGVMFDSWPVADHCMISHPRWISALADYTAARGVSTVESLKFIGRNHLLEPAYFPLVEPWGVGLNRADRSLGSVGELYGFRQYATDLYYQNRLPRRKWLYDYVQMHSR